MSILNVNNLLSVLEEKIKSLDTSEEILIFSKCIEQLKLGILYVVPNLADLPDSEENGLLYFVENEESVYFRTNKVWKPIIDDFYSSLWTWGSLNKTFIFSQELTEYTSPICAITTFTDWTSVSSGTQHMVGLRKNGTIWSWGYGGAGRLANNSVLESINPVQESSCASDWCQVSAGYYHTLALKNNGSLWAWGSNLRGTLGINSSLPRSNPTSVVGNISDWKYIEAFSYANVAIRSNNSAWTWGGNEAGRLGDGTTTSRSSPVSIVGNISWKSISIGCNHALGINLQGVGFSWGSNNLSQGGNIYTNTSVLSPVSLFEGIVSCNWKKITGSMESSAGIKSDGSVWVWGKVGLYDNSFRFPKEIPTDKDWLDISGNVGHVLLLKCNRTLWAWGWNYGGHLGDGTTIDRSSPVQVCGGFSDWCAISTSSYGSFGLRSNGTLWAWGVNSVYSTGNLGTGDSTGKSSPVLVVGGFTDWCRIPEASRYFTHAIRSNGTLWGWGCFGVVGDGTTIGRSSPVSVVGGFTDWCFVKPASYHTLAIRSNGTLWAWGANPGGSLGDGTTINRSSPVSVIGGFTDWCQSTGDGNGFSLGLRSNNTLWSWGWNFSGELGNGTATDRSSPVQILSSITNWCSITSSFRAGIALRSTGEAWAWGSNSGNGGAGKLTGYKTSRLVAGPISDDPFSCLTNLVAGRFFSAGIDCKGVLATWGYNRYGRTGTESENDTQIGFPKKVVGGFTDWCTVSLTAGTAHAVRSNGTAWSWGANWQGLLGDGTNIDRSSPVSVIGGFTDWCCISAAGRAYSSTFVNLIGIRQRNF